MANPEFIKGQLRTYNLMYYAQVVALVFFATVVYFITSSGALGPPDYSLAVFFQTIILVVVPLALLAGYFVFKAMVARINPKDTFKERFKRYFTLILIRSAIFEVPGLLCCVAALITHNTLFLVTVIMIVFLFLLLRPTVQSISEDLNLSGSESALLH